MKISIFSTFNKEQFPKIYGRTNNWLIFYRQKMEFLAIIANGSESIRRKKQELRRKALAHLFSRPQSSQNNYILVHTSLGSTKDLYQVQDTLKKLCGFSIVLADPADLGITKTAEQKVMYATFEASFFMFSWAKNDLKKIKNTLGSLLKSYMMYSYKKWQFLYKEIIRN